MAVGYVSALRGCLLKNFGIFLDTAELKLDAVGSGLTKVLGNVCERRRTESAKFLPRSTE